MGSEQNTRPLSVKILGWKSLRKNTLRGFATVQLGALKIVDVTVHCREDKRWIALPGKVMISRDGSVMRDDRGRPKYERVLDWLDETTAKRFETAVLSALEQEYPAALSAS